MAQRGREILMRSVTVVCADVVGRKMAGPAIRALELCRALSPRFRTTLVSRSSGDFTICPGVEFVEASDETIREVAARSDVIVVQGDVLVRWPDLRRARAALVADLYCPLPLELLETSAGADIAQRWPLNEQASMLLIDQMLHADYFICASERQADLWLGALVVLNRVNPLRFPTSSNSSIEGVLTVVPFGIPEPRSLTSKGKLRAKFGIASDDIVLLWGGGIYEWFDPETLILAVEALNKGGRKVHLVFLGGTHPASAVSHDRRALAARSLADRLGLLGNRVHFNEGWIDYDDRFDYFADADLGVIAHHPTLETRYSFRTRVLDYLWAGLPVLCTEGDHFAQEIASHSMGAVARYGNVEDWASLIAQFSAEQRRADARVNVIGYAKEHRWSCSVAPLIPVLERLDPAPDRALVRSGMLVLLGHRIPSLVLRADRAFQRGGLGALVSGVRRRAVSRLKRLVA
jgi:glycosyltransferase involved in cell wall biosynthesis